MIGLLSQARMSTYVTACSGNVEDAVELYRWNLDISMALFEAIHYLEVATRNRIDDALTQLAGLGADWLDSPPSVPLSNGTKNRILKARNFAGPNATHGHVIAEITFGFWPKLFAANYSGSLWKDALKATFPKGTRSGLNADLTGVADLRNRIGHHEPLIALDITAEYERILSLAEIVDPHLGWWIDSTSRVAAVNKQRPV